VEIAQLQALLDLFEGHFDLPAASDTDRPRRWRSNRDCWSKTPSRFQPLLLPREDDRTFEVQQLKCAILRNMDEISKTIGLNQALCEI
jgi:hypothetical protein